MALAEHEVQQRWASYEEMATRGPARFPADARSQHQEEPGHQPRAETGGTRWTYRPSTWA